ncbi:MAG: hypothetical protein FJ290_08030 [Planctomycetes bacterium]|nr:hypothetical protein [Planctomycetota bacterium]
MSAVSRILAAMAAVAACGSARGEVATQRLRPGAGTEPNVLRFELPQGAKVLRADLLVARAGELTGRDDEALASIEIVPQGGGKPLGLRPPWLDRFDATEALRAASRVPRAPTAQFVVKTFPRWDAKATRLDVTSESVGGASLPREGAPPPVKGVKALHRAGQTFVTFEEIDERSAAPSPTWAELKKQLDAIDAEREVRYRVYRHTAPITAATLAEAEWLADVRPMSGYNTLGRSVDQLIALHRRRAMGDLDFSKQLARQDYFSKYNPDMPEMGEVPIARFAIEDGKPLPPKSGLHVHTVCGTAGLPSRVPPDATKSTAGQADRATTGKAYYAVVAAVDGVINGRSIACVGPVEETVGFAEPVLQGKADVTVFFDYPGERRHYVQWAAPPLSNLPNQHTNWGLFVPRGYDKAAAKRLSVFFHDATQRWLKPPWPHRQDTVLLSPHDAPWRSFGYGHHEALGTLRSFRQGKVQPFLARRVDAMLDWAMKRFGADAGRVSCGGSGYWGGTAALQYGLRRPGKIAYVMADALPDPNPNDTSYEYEMYGKRKTARPEMDSIWGKAEWKIEAESGKPIWDEMNLVAHVQANGRKQAMPYISLGAGSQHLTWRQETDLMKAYLATHNAFMAEFFWGSSHHLPLPVSAESGDHPFEPRADRPLLACNPRDRGPEPKFFEKHFDTGERGYSSGGRLNTRPRWDPEEIVDEPDRLEMTIYCARRVVYAGRETCDVAVRNTAKFRPKPGEKLAWTAPDPREPRKTIQGEATVDEEGHILIPGLTFGEPGKLIIRRKGGEQ